LPHHPSTSLAKSDTPLNITPPTTPPILATFDEQVLFSGCDGGRVCCWHISTALPEPSAEEPPAGAPAQTARQLFAIDALAEPIWEVVVPALGAPPSWNRCCSHM
jgi:hypothetical protein